MRHPCHNPRSHGHGDRRFARGAMRGEEFGHRGPRHGHQHGPGGRRGGRMFDHGELRLVVLALIGEQPRHGYEIIKEIEDRVGGSYSPSPGVIYPTLTLLEELGHARAEEREGKKLFAATGEGSAWLATNQPALEVALARMQAAKVASRDGQHPGILRATENLRMAMRLRLGRGSLTEAEAQAIAEALDTAARAIERS